jgi:hypothetical protein
VRKISVRFGICQPGDFGMKKSRFSEQQMAFILKQAEDGTTVECPPSAFNRHTGCIK